MIAGLGIDLVETERIETAIKRGDGRFLAKICTEREIAYCDAKARPAQHYAARFAAKEAFFKAVGRGIGDGIEFTDIEVVNEEGGRPVLVLHGAAKDIAQAMGITQTQVSLSHSRDNAVAVVVCER